MKKLFLFSVIFFFLFIFLFSDLENGGENIFVLEANRLDLTGANGMVANDPYTVGTSPWVYAFNFSKLYREKSINLGVSGSFVIFLLN